MMSYISPVKSSSNVVSLGATKWDKMSSMRSQCANDNAGLSTWKGRRNWWKDGAVASQKLEELNGFQQKWGGRCRLCFARNFVGLSLKGMSSHRFFPLGVLLNQRVFPIGLPIGFCYTKIIMFPYFWMAQSHESSIFSAHGWVPARQRKKDICSCFIPVSTLGIYLWSIVMGVPQKRWMFFFWGKIHL